MRWFSLLFLLLSDAVPFDGMLRLGWSGMVVVALFWIEVAMNVPFTLARIALHRYFASRGRGLPGDLSGKPAKESRLLRAYALEALLQVFFMGIFIAVLLAFCLVALASDHPDWEDDRLFSVAHLIRATQSMAVAIVLWFASDVASIRRRSYAWVDAHVAVQRDRSISLFFGLILGIFAMIATQSPLAVAYVLLGLKTAADVYRWHCMEKADGAAAQGPRAQVEPIQATATRAQ